MVTDMLLLVSGLASTGGLRSGLRALLRGPGHPETPVCEVVDVTPRPRTVQSGKRGTQVIRYSSTLSSLADRARTAAYGLQGRRSPSSPRTPVMKLPDPAVCLYTRRTLLPV